MLLAAAAVHAVFGFGTALVAMPLLAFFLPLATATPLVGFAALTTVLLILARDWRQVELRPTVHLLLASVFGLPPGLLLLNSDAGTAGRILLGTLLVFYSVFSLLRTRAWPRAPAWVVYPAGFLAGVFGAAFNINAPPVVVYGTLVRWPPAQFRATLQGFFLPSAILICAAHGAAGLWTGTVVTLYLWAIPAILAGNLGGRALARHITPARFVPWLHALLGVLGGVLLWTA